MTEEERFWSKVDFLSDPHGCWLWTASKSRGGYGQFNTRRGDHKLWRAHRLAYVYTVGTLDEALQLDHLCRNRACVNPAHLEPVTQHENILRGESLPAFRARQTHCLNGHELTPDNVYRTKKNQRYCRECGRVRNRASYYRKVGRDVA